MKSRDRGLIHNSSWNKHPGLLCCLLVTLISSAMGAEPAAQVRKLSGDEVVTALDFLADRIKSNYSRIHSLVGTYDVVDEYWGPSVAKAEEELRNGREGNQDTATNRRALPASHYKTDAVAKIWLRADGNEVRSDYAESQATMELDPATEKLIATHRLDEFKFIRTAEHFIRFPMTEVRNNVPGFPEVSGTGRAGRIIYREAPLA